MTTKPKGDYNAHDGFFIEVVETHILAAAMKVLGMESLNDAPSPDVVSPNVWMQPDDEREKKLLEIAKLIVSKYVDFTTFEEKSARKDKVLSYACDVLSLGLFYLEFCDSIREGDGLRVS